MTYTPHQVNPQNLDPNFYQQDSMEEFTPPISERDTEELIEIAYSSTEHWRQEAIDQSKIELIKRNISKKEQEEIIEDWNKASKQYFKLEAKRLQNNKTESYQIWEMGVIFLFGPILIIRPYLFNSHTLFTLRGENYFLKFKKRLIIFALCFVAWFFYINYSMELSDKKRMAEIEKIDISEWIKRYGSE